MIPQSHSKNHKLNARLGAILSQVSLGGTVSVSNLAAALQVSEETIRRDARVLVARGDVLKLHGSLTMPYKLAEAPFDRRMRENAEAKRAIARRAVQLVEDGDTLVVDTGTTTSLFAQELRSRRGLTVVTNSSDIARTLATVNGNRVYMAGGELKADNGAAFGPSAVEFISRFKVRHAFLSIAALHHEHGPMNAALEEADISHIAMNRADRLTILTDSSKFGKTALVRICDLRDIDNIVCESAPDGDLRAALAEAEVTVLTATDRPSAYEGFTVSV